MAQATGQAGFQQPAPTTIDIPLAGQPLQRGTGTTDQRCVNVFFETIKNPITQGTSLYCVKRPGLSNFSQPPLGAATGRGLYYWGGSNKLYSVFANKIYSGTTDLGVTLAASTGKVWFTENEPTSASRALIVSDGTDNYNITTGDSIAQIDETDDAQYPQANLGPVLFFNSYLFQGQADGEIWNTEADSITSWLGTAVVSSEQYGDSLIAIAKQKDQIIAFGRFSTEFFFDNANTGSPLQRIDQNSLQIGMSHANTLAQSGDNILWVSENPAHGDGGRSVWQIYGMTKVKVVSTPVIDRFLAAEGTAISSATCWIERVAGHHLYVLNLSTADRTFVYDLNEETWCEWEIAAGGAKFNGMAATSNAGTVYIQDATNGRIYTLDPAIFRDSGANFTVTLQTDNYDFGTPFSKFEEGLWLIGDNTTGTINITESDDDYTTFNTARTIDMTATRKFLPEGGMFFQRAYRATYTQNAALRLSKLVLKLKVGNS